jgi:hypothetical protein
MAIFNSYVKLPEGKNSRSKVLDPAESTTTFPLLPEFLAAAAMNCVRSRRN